MSRINIGQNGETLCRHDKDVEIPTPAGKLLKATRKYGLQTVVAITLLTALTGIVTLVVQSALKSTIAANVSVGEAAKETAKIAHEAHAAFNKTLVDLSGAIKDNTASQGIQTQVLQQMAAESRTTNERLLTLDRRLLDIERSHHTPTVVRQPVPMPRASSGDALATEPD